MELIPINESKLKIMLSENDMKELNICDEADCANNETRYAIRTILERAKAQIGFNTEGAEIFVQLYTSRSGGCELFVTKGASPNNTEQDHGKKQKKTEKPNKKIADAIRISQVPESEPLKKDKRDLSYYMSFSFESVRDLCSACRILKKKELDITSSAYTGDDGKCYIILGNTCLSAYTRLDSLSFLHEYGKRERSDQIITYLCEHGREICLDNAVEILSEL